LPPPGAEPEGVDPFPDPIKDDYVHYLERSTNRSMLTGQRRSKTRDILRNPEMSIDVGDRNENARLRNLKVWWPKEQEHKHSQRGGGALGEPHAENVGADGDSFILFISFV
jgi:hypothetical protein